MNEMRLEDVKMIIGDLVLNHGLTTKRLMNENARLVQENKRLQAELDKEKGKDE